MEQESSKGEKNILFKLIKPNTIWVYVMLLILQSDGDKRMKYTDFFEK